MNAGTGHQALPAAPPAETITGLLQDMKELIVQAQHLNDGDRTRIQTDIGPSLRTQIGNTVNAAQFNGVNLLKGTDSMSVLASLDRGSDGTVSATNISVSRNDLATNAVAGTAKADGDAGCVSSADTTTATDVDKTAGTAGTITASQAGDLADTETLTLTIKGGAVAAGDVFAFTIGGADISYNRSFRRRHQRCGCSFAYGHRQ
ncbi:MAG: hypothetical protein R3C04_07755 [Hyphomonas sp.]